MSLQQRRPDQSSAVFLTVADAEGRLGLTSPRTGHLFGAMGVAALSMGWCGSMQLRSAPIAVLAFFCSCAPTTQEIELRRLAKTLESSQARLAKIDERLEDLSNQVFLLTDELKTRAVARAALGDAPAGLKVIRLLPEDTLPLVEQEPAIDIILSGPEEPPNPAQASAAKPPSRPSADMMFQKALRAFRKGRFRLAWESFDRFTRAHPRHPNADNALFWMGECRYELREFGKAVGPYERIIRGYPGSRKIPDALLKLGLCYEHLGARHKAREAFSSLLHDYPRSALAELARARLGPQGSNSNQGGGL